MDAKRSTAINKVKFVTLTKPKVNVEELNISGQLFKFLPVTTLRNKPRKLDNKE